MIAVSPFALLDMLIVLWRNLRMMNQISEVYGLQLGYWGRVKLIRKIFHTMVYAGAAEILSDAGNYALGAGVTGKLSTRVAQGMGAGVLTARIGLKAINESRPLPWLSEEKPGLSVISKQLLADLHNQLR
jgi:putative membrane protein